ncbi:DUF1684 domain-containing protein [Dawidia soli]|uniref:DUF1684 domain-containing protein n=1 Tax=Dawidia soli TaxID=2782352 RepID=A0AAP2DCQ2_9BACT|nr:DUF1684 domain-containing protein [Dawidia soli]MBT1689594.1 DUF1684 domain-containing protein [Dawidia soli]
MKKQSIIILVIVVAAVIALLYSFTGSQDQGAYTDKIQQERDSKDVFMRTSKESPFAGDSTATFKGLQYYPVDARYKVTASLTPITNKQVVLLATNDEKEQRYVQYAYADFDLGGYHNRLLILEMIDMGPFRGKLFLAFGDETSAVETYGAGRYLDLNKVQGANTITLDFNLAYNPYCAYSDKFSCPLPPTENLLKVAIRAGERQYH